jgi:hypothetical protein
MLFSSFWALPLTLFCRCCVGGCPPVQMADSKALSGDTLVVEVAAGKGIAGSADGPVDLCRFQTPSNLCRFGNLLFVTDYVNCTIRAVEGVVGVADPLADHKSDRRRV